MSSGMISRIAMWSAASLSAASGGAIMSKPGELAVATSVDRPPVMRMIEASPKLNAAEMEVTLWSVAYAAPVPVSVEQVSQVKPWRFVGVIGEGASGRAVFSSPDSSAQTLLVKAGETLPDGRKIAKIGISDVRFAAEPSNTGGGLAPAAQATVKPGGEAALIRKIAFPDLDNRTISLFSGVDANAASQQ